MMIAPKKRLTITLLSLVLLIGMVGPVLAQNPPPRRPPVPVRRGKNPSPGTPRKRPTFQSASGSAKSSMTDKVVDSYLYSLMENLLTR